MVPAQRLEHLGILFDTSSFRASLSREWQVRLLDTLKADRTATQVNVMTLARLMGMFVSAFRLIHPFYQTWRLKLKTSPHLSFLDRLSSPKKNPKLSTTSMKNSMWTVHPIGCLGNLMGKYATLYTLDKLNGHQAYIHPSMHQNLSSIFQITLPVIHSVGKIHWRNFTLHDWMSKDYHHIQSRNVQLMSYPCSFTFYLHIYQVILQEFSFHNHIKEEANQYLLSLCGQHQNVTFVGVHVRRGDYVRVMPRIWRAGME
ncbi:hypothetical protein lerEdw1_016458 [Lerista edwardsae]|nr:hypothetical protein lerEdw1_016458 [Lerista edwardsae]